MFAVQLVTPERFYPKASDCEAWDFTAPKLMAQRQAHNSDSYEYRAWVSFLASAAQALRLQSFAFSQKIEGEL